MNTVSEELQKDIFISYSRKQLVFARRLYQDLTELGFKVWFDQNDIPLAVDFLNEIERGIRHSHYFLFLLSPDSAASIYCKKEIEYAQDYGKRIFPILCEATSGSDVLKTEKIIARLNWIYGISEQEDVFPTMIEKLHQLLKNDYDQSKFHTELICSAIEWKSNFHSDQFLLHGNRRLKAETWLEMANANPKDNSQPTDLLCEFICESRKNASFGNCEVFISYHTSDKKIYKAIFAKLVRKGISVWKTKRNHLHREILNHDLLEGIELAENVIFILSPNHLSDESFLARLEHATALNKRIFCWLTVEKSQLKIPKKFAKLIFLSNESNVKESFLRLFRELGVEKQYYSRHRDFLVNAIRWKNNQFDDSLLLLGSSLQMAQSWLKVAEQRSNHSAPEITKQFILKSQAVNSVFSCEVFLVAASEDLDFANKLCLALKLNKRSSYFTLVDGLADDKAAQHLAEISNSDNFLLVLTPESLESEACLNYLKLANDLGKRVILAISKKLNPNRIPPELKKCLSVTFSNQGDDFTVALGELLNLLNFDREHVIGHTRWLQLAENWSEKDESNDLLLRGKALLEAEQWLSDALSQEKQPVPSPLHQKYIEESRKIEVREQDLELRRQHYLKELEIENENLKKTRESVEKIGIVDRISKRVQTELQFPDITRIFSREKEADHLIQVLEDAKSEENKLVLLSGDEGSRLSILLHGIEEKLTKKGFICLKCDIIEGEKSPFQALAKLANDLTLQLLRNDENLHVIKPKLEQRLQGNGKVLVDVMPSLDLLLGEQKDVIPLDPKRARERLKLNFAAFINCIRETNEPIVFMIKDLDLIDESSLDLLASLFNPRSDVKHFSIIASHRAGLSDMTAVNKHFNSENPELFRYELLIENIQKRDLLFHFSQLFQLTEFSVSPLIELIHSKTDGNPFLIQQLLKHAYEEKQLYWDQNKKSWAWNLKEIEQVEIIKNVEERSRHEIEKLPHDDLNMLAAAACFGMKFTLSSLEKICRKVFKSSVPNLIPFIHQRLIIPISENYKITETTQKATAQDPQQHFRFTSDHLRRLAIERCGDTELKLIRIEIGKMLLNKLSSDHSDELKYQTATHLNEAMDLLQGNKLIVQAANCNLQAGNSALQAGSYQAALEYFSKGFEHISKIEQAWEQHQELCFQLKLAHAKTHFFCGNSQLAAHEIEGLIDKASSLNDKVNCYIACCNSMQSNGKAAESLKYAKEGLQLFGIKIPQSEAEYEAETETLIALLTQDSTMDLLDSLPQAKNEHLLIGELYQAYVISVYFVEPQHLPWICCRNLEHVLNHGFTPGARQSMAWFSMILMMLGNHKLSHEYAELAVDESSKNSNSLLSKSQTSMIAWAMSLAWKYPFAKTEQVLHHAFPYCHNNGDFQYASYILITEYIAKLMQADDLLGLFKLCQNWKEHCEHFAPLELGQAKIRLSLLEQLIGVEASEEIDAEQIIFEYEALNNQTDVCESLLELARVSLLFNDSEKAFMYCKRAEPSQQAGAAGTLLLNFLHLHIYCICCARIYKERMRNGQEVLAVHYETKGKELLEKMRKLAALNTDNFESYLLLTEAEWAAAYQMDGPSFELYLKVAYHQRTSEYTLLRGMALEGLSNYCREQHYGLSEAYAEQAILYYVNCGALGKARDLEAKLNASGKNFIPSSQFSTEHPTSEHELIEALLQFNTCNDRASLQKIMLENLYQLINVEQLALFDLKSGSNLQLMASMQHGIYSDQADEVMEISEGVLEQHLRQKYPDATINYPINVHIRKLEKSPGRYAATLESNGKFAAVLYLESKISTFTPNQLRIIHVLSEQFARLFVFN